MGKEFDILYCSMTTPTTTSHYEELKKNVFFDVYANCIGDKANVMSFRGWSNCKVLYEKIHDKETFSWSLKIVKTIAKQRGIYGFNYGYLNGISLIIMLVKAEMMLKEQLISRSLPRLESLTLNEGSNDKTLNERVQDLVFFFFEIYSTWDFRDPIMI